MGLWAVAMVMGSLLELANDVQLPAMDLGQGACADFFSTLHDDFETTPGRQIWDIFSDTIANECYMII